MTAAPLIPVLYVVDKMTVGGTQRHLSQVMRGMNRAGVDPWLCCLQGLGLMANGLPNDRLLCLDMKRIYGPGALRGFRTLTRFIREHGIQVVHTYLFSANLFGVAAARAAGAPVVVTSRRGTPYGRRAHHFAALQVSDHFADAVVVNSEALVSFISETENLPQSRIVKIYNGIDAFEISPAMREDMRSSLGFAPGDLVVGMLAGFRAIKDHATALRAAARVAEGHPRARFLFVGEGPTRRPCMEQAAALGIADRCVFTGERPDTVALAQAMDVGLVSSIEEGFPNALLEMMMAGHPCVATDISGNNEAVLPGETGMLCPVGDDARIAEALGALLADVDTRTRMGTAARALVLDRYGMDTMLNSMAGLYRALLPASNHAHP